METTSESEVEKMRIEEVIEVLSKMPINSADDRLALLIAKKYVRKEIPKPVVQHVDFDEAFYICPICEAAVDSSYYRYCTDCGQRITEADND